MNNKGFCPYLPIWARQGNKVIKEWSQPVASGDAYGVEFLVIYEDSRGKQHEATKWIKWEQQYSGKDYFSKLLDKLQTNEKSGYVEIPKSIENSKDFYNWLQED